MKPKLFFLYGLFIIFASCGETGDPSVPDQYEDGSWTPFRGEGFGAGTDGVTQAPSASDTYKSGEFEPSSDFKGLCQEIRTGTDLLGNIYDDVQGETLDENNWLRSWSNETYLWYDEIPDQNPANFSDPVTYFHTLKTSRADALGNAIDNFHFTEDSELWSANSTAGVLWGYGALWIETSSSVPYELTIAYVEPGSPADEAGWERGDTVDEVNGVPYEEDVSTVEDFVSLFDGLYPSALTSTNEFRIRKRSGSYINTTVTASAVAYSPVPKVETLSDNGDKVGYMVFNDHTEVSEVYLWNAFNSLASENIDDLVIDLRYNTGGLLYIASQVAYMIAGSQTNDEVFLQYRYNDQYSTTDPWGFPVTATPFYNALSDNYSDTNEFLPTLDLSRVFVLTTSNTCSASEAIMNGLRGIDVEVIQIGTSTCGKPYGFVPQDNCGTTYFTLQFQSENAKGFGDFQSGFAPQNARVAGSVELPGCYVADDFDNDLGDPNEDMLKAALDYRTNDRCPSSLIVGSSKSSVIQSEKLLLPPWKKGMY